MAAGASTHGGRHRANREYGDTALERVSALHEILSVYNLTPKKGSQS